MLSWIKNYRFCRYKFEEHGTSLTQLWCVRLCHIPCSNETPTLCCVVLNIVIFSKRCLLKILTSGSHPRQYMGILEVVAQISHFFKDVKCVCVCVCVLFIFISWRLITSQYCSGFCHTLTWISHGVTCIPHPDPPSHLPLHPSPLGLPSAPGPSTCLMHPTWAGDLFHYR